MDFWVSMALAVLFQVVKNPKKTAELKKALRKLRDALNQTPLDEAK